MLAFPTIGGRPISSNPSVAPLVGLVFLPLLPSFEASPLRALSLEPLYLLLSSRDWGLTQGATLHLPILGTFLASLTSGGGELGFEPDWILPSLALSTLVAGVGLLEASELSMRSMN